MRIRPHAYGSIRDGKQPIGLGLRLFYWTDGVWPWIVSLDLLVGPLDLQLGIHSELDATPNRRPNRAKWNEKTWSR